MSNFFNCWWFEILLAFIIAFSAAFFGAWVSYQFTKYEKRRTDMHKSLTKFEKDIHDTLLFIHQNNIQDQGDLTYYFGNVLKSLQTNIFMQPGVKKIEVLDKNTYQLKKVCFYFFNFKKNHKILEILLVMEKAFTDTQTLAKDPVKKNYGDLSKGSFNELWGEVHKAMNAVLIIMKG